jgi:hypothetical protein
MARVNRVVVIRTAVDDQLVVTVDGVI